MIKLISAAFVALVGSFSLVQGGYPETYQVGYGFVSNGGIGPHGHYLPAVARVKVHKDPFQSHYSLDEEGPTHYKYIRHSKASDPVIYPPALDIGGHYPHHHHHHHVAPIATPAVPVPLPIHGHGHIHGGVIAPTAIAVPTAAAVVGYGGEPYYNDYGAYPHAHHGGYY